MELEAVTPTPARVSIGPLAVLAGDERLARLVARGDETACRVLYDRYQQPLYRYCRSLLRSEADAQDALQTTFISALGALSRGQRDAPIRPWLFRIAHNESISLLRRRLPEHELADVPEESTAPLEEHVVERERLALLVSDLNELPERQRAALVMRELSGLSHQEIALALDASVGATKQAIFEARRSLMEFAEGRAMTCEEVRKRVSDADGRVLRSRRHRAHLRHCAGCAAFAAAIPERSRQLRVLVPPLPALTAAGIFARNLSGGSAHGGDAAGLGVAGAPKAVGATIALKATAVAVGVTATVGAAVALRHPTPSIHPDRVVPAVGPPSAVSAGHAAGVGRSGAAASRTMEGVRSLVPTRRSSGVGSLTRASTARGRGKRTAKRTAVGVAAIVSGTTAAARSATAVGSVSARTSGQAGGASQSSRGLPTSRGLGPPAYPGQRSQSSAKQSSPSHGSGPRTSTSHVGGHGVPAGGHGVPAGVPGVPAGGPGAGVTTHPPHPALPGSSATVLVGNSGVTPGTAKPDPPHPPRAGPGRGVPAQIDPNSSSPAASTK